MSESEITAWKEKERKKRKAIMQMENRAKKKKMFQEVQSMLTTLEDHSESNEASDADAGNIKVVKTADGTSRDTSTEGKALDITSCDVTCSGGLEEYIEDIIRSLEDDDTGAKKPHPNDHKMKALRESPRLVRTKSFEVVDDDTQGLVANNASMSGTDLSKKIVDYTIATDISGDAHDKDEDHETEVLSEEYEFNLFHDIIENIEDVNLLPHRTRMDTAATYLDANKSHDATDEFDGLFNPVDTDAEDYSIVENDISVIDDSFLDYLLLQK